MKRTFKKTAKKNLFDDDGEDTNVIEQSPLGGAEDSNNKKIIGMTDQRYDAHKIEENQHYVGWQKKQQELKAQNVKKQQLEAKNKNSKTSKKKKKLLLESDEENEQKQRQADLEYKNQKSAARINIRQQQEDQQEDRPNINKNIFQDHTQPKQKDEQEGQDDIQDKNEEDQGQNQELRKSQEQQRQRAEKMKQMINSSTKPQDKQLKQLSFNLLLDKTQNNKASRKKLMYTPIPKGYRVTCVFRRVSTAISQTYSLVTENDNSPVLFCQNQRGSIGANYYISLTKEMDKNSVNYLGKLRGNSTGSIYQLYDDGKQPSKNINRKQWRISMGRIEYETNILGMNGPRKLKVVVPHVETYQQFDSFKLAQKQQLTSFQPPLVANYRNKQPRWNERLKSYALNFGGRVKQASIKNFILVNDEISSQQQFTATNTLVFGKIDDNSFSLEAIYPLSLFQAFGIVMSQFDFKLNCE